MYYWAIAILLILLFLYIRSAMCEQRTRKEGFESRDARKELLESQVGVLNSIKNEATKMLQKYINKRIEFAGKVDEEFRYSLPGEF